MSDLTFTIRIAEKNIQICPLFPYAQNYCKSYLIHAPADIVISITPQDIALEAQKAAAESKKEGLPVFDFPEAYLETLAIYRKIATILLEESVLLFHGSVVAVDGVAYLFTAKSGTGKSTHTRLWREHFGQRAVMVNDDKPLIRVTETGATVYGTPWDGKHRLSTNCAVPLRAICLLERGLQNHITPISRRDAYPMLVQQTYKPNLPQKLIQTLQCIDLLAASVSLYRFSCNLLPEAALVAYQAMKP